MFNHANGVLNPAKTAEAQVAQDPDGTWKLIMSAGQAGSYRLAQLDDYRGIKRRKLPWMPPLLMSLEAKISRKAVPGTWGFGLWNDPFSAGLGFGGGLRRLPALPNAAWFFFASPENHLSLRDDLPASGALAAGFRAPHWPWPLLGLAALAFPLLLLPQTAAVLRPRAAQIVQQDAKNLALDTTRWHRYDLEWRIDRVSYWLDGSPVHQSPLSAQGPLAVVIWLDNQFAALPPSGGLRMGSLANSEPIELKIKNFRIEQIE